MQCHVMATSHHLQQVGLLIKHCVRFLSRLDEMPSAPELVAVCKKHPPRSRTRPKLSAAQVNTGLSFRQLSDRDTLTERCGQLHEAHMSDSAYARQRRLLPEELFEEIMHTAPQQLAEESRRVECFYEHLRLLRARGTQRSVSNTRTILEQLPELANRHPMAAFAKLRLVCMIKLEAHAPVATVATPASEGEQTLARQRWDKELSKLRTVADRLTGATGILDELISGTARSGVVFLVPIRDYIGVRVPQRLPDGSALVQVPVRKSNRIVRQLQLREIGARGLGASEMTFTRGLWITLLAPRRPRAAFERDGDSLLIRARRCQRQNHLEISDTRRSCRNVVRDMVHASCLNRSVSSCAWWGRIPYTGYTQIKWIRVWHHRDVQQLQFVLRTVKSTRLH